MLACLLLLCVPAFALNKNTKKKFGISLHHFKLHPHAHFAATANVYIFFLSDFNYHPWERRNSNKKRKRESSKWGYEKSTRVSGSIWSVTGWIQQMHFNSLPEWWSNSSSGGGIKLFFFLLLAHNFCCASSNTFFFSAAPEWTAVCWAA